MSVLGRQGVWQGPAPTAHGNSAHMPGDVSAEAFTGIWLLSVGRSRNRQAGGLLAFKRCNSTSIQSWVSVDGKHGSILKGAVDKLSALHRSHSEEFENEQSS